MTPWPHEPRHCLTPPTVLERSPAYNPWESRVHVRAASVVCVYPGRRVLACLAFPTRGTDCGLGVALAKALLTCATRRDSVSPTTESGPGGAETPRGPDETFREVTP